MRFGECLHACPCCETGFVCARQCDEPYTNICGSCRRDGYEFGECEGCSDFSILVPTMDYVAAEREGTYVRTTEHFEPTGECSGLCHSCTEIRVVK